MKGEMSKSAAIGIAAVLVLILGVAFWARTAPQQSGKAYSEGVARLEANAESVKQAEQAEKWRQENPEAAKAQRELTRDKEFQPESDR